MKQDQGWISHQEILERLHLAYHEALRIDRMGVQGAMSIAQDIYDAAMLIQDMKRLHDEERKQLHGKPQ